MIAVKGLIALGLVMAGVFVVIFLGGLASAALEIRSERRAGKPVTRPGWESRDKRRAIGSRRERARVWWVGMTRPGVCWCGLGPLQEFRGADGPERGCAAWEAGHPVAIRRHDEAGGYVRVPAA